MPPNESPTSIESLRDTAWDGALHADGTAHVFDMRAQKLARRLRRLTFAGVAVPATVGSIAAGGIPLPWLLPVSVAVAAVLGIAQLIASVWALAANWSGNYAQALQSMSINQKLADSYERLARLPPDSDQMRLELHVLTTQDWAQRDLDRRQEVTAPELRMGMRAALRKFGRKCVACEKIPISMTPTTCEVCGAFPRRWAK